MERTIIDLRTVNDGTSPSPAKRRFVTTRRLGARVLAALQSWFDNQRPCRSTSLGERSTDIADLPRPLSISSAHVLSFPIRGEALLVQMAERLRQRVGDRGGAHEPLVLTLSRCPHSRLTIDWTTYVEFNPQLATYRVVIDAAPGTRFTIETADFDMVVSFIAPYVTDRLSDRASLEAAS